MTISVITPTADRPVAFALAERWMARQTVPPDEWIVGDGGQDPVVCSMGQQHVHHPTPAGAGNFASNLLRALAQASGDVIVIVEDDDAYAPTHLAQLAGQLEGTGAQLAGDDQQRYYHVGHRRWRSFDNEGASLCQTALRRAVVPVLTQVIRTCRDRGTYGIDAVLWRAVPRTQWSLERSSTVVGIKGLPGRVGLGIGHRSPVVAGWTADPDLTTLRAWLGADADVYAAFGEPAVLA